MSDFLEARYEKDPSIVYREIAGEAVLVPIRRNVADMDCIYTLDGVGVSIWSLIDGRHTLGDIQRSILEEYDVDADVLGSDLVDFVRQLESIGAIRVRQGGLS